MEALASSAGTLEVLELDKRNYWLPEDLSKVFSRLVHLKRLRIDDIYTGRPFRLSSLPTFRLEHFEAHQVLDAAVLGGILSSSTESLESLTIDVTVDTAVLALHRFTRFRTITIRWQEVGEDMQEIRSLTPLFKSLGTCTNLKTLDLAYGSQYSHRPPSIQFDALPLLRLLPPSVHLLPRRGFAAAQHRHPPRNPLPSSPTSPPQPPTNVRPISVHRQLDVGDGGA